MTQDRPSIGIPVDVKTFGDDTMHVVGEKYIAAVAHGAGAKPLLVPALGQGPEMASLNDVIAPETMLDGLDGLFLTGSPSNMKPSFYGDDSEGVAPFDEQRDRTTLALLRAALARDLPILALCRGFQELNVACGGTLYTAVHEQTDYNDHRDDHDQPRAERYQPRHPVTLTENGLLTQLAGTRQVEVNSLHGQGVAQLGPSLAVEAIAPDGLIEAARHPDRSFAVGVQWHPEWQFADNPFSKALFTAFGDAARAGMQG
ncbi:gamma-glutamyl-gamma-aminobutyrate hydrolase family protein [Salinisphaera orenii]|uniref:gamma-glutamyl-gamma-aminobutyrate hydrolase family protein n=1 Tax=Salinisphaera orenii TaxID=856731 RepID=UPI000DBE2517